MTFTIDFTSKLEVARRIPNYELGDRNQQLKCHNIEVLRFREETLLNAGKI